MCKENEYFNGATGLCVPISKAMDEKKYDGSTSIWGYIPAGLTGISQVISSLKGNNTAPVTNVYNQSPTGGGSMLWIILAVVALIIVLVVAFKNK